MVEFDRVQRSVERPPFTQSLNECWIGSGGPSSGSSFALIHDLKSFEQFPEMVFFCSVLRSVSPPLDSLSRFQADPPAHGPAKKIVSLLDLRALRVTWCPYFPMLKPSCSVMVIKLIFPVPFTLAKWVLDLRTCQNQRGAFLQWLVKRHMYIEAKIQWSGCGRLCSGFLAILPE